jgi:hypothetical protein
VKAAIVTFWKGEQQIDLHVPPDDLLMVLSAAGGHGFRNQFSGYADCDADDHDGRCRCFDGEDDADGS